MRFTIRARTARHGDAPLCHSCRFATIVRGQAQDHEIIECGQLSDRHQRITFPVTYCTRYVSKQHPSIREMEEIAWVLRSDLRRNQIGFVEARKLKPEDRYVLQEEWD